MVFRQKEEVCVFHRKDSKANEVVLGNKKKSVFSKT
jgi:hypothetical protein